MKKILTKYAVQNSIGIGTTILFSARRQGVAMEKNSPLLQGVLVTNNNHHENGMGYLRSISRSLVQWAERNGMGHTGSNPEEYNSSGRPPSGGFISNAANIPIVLDGELDVPLDIGKCVLVQNFQKPRIADDLRLINLVASHF